MKNLLSRQPPQSLEAEQAVLGSMLIDSRCVSGCRRASCSPEDFYLQQNREIYETPSTPCSTISQTIDPVTVLDQTAASWAYYEDKFHGIISSS